MCCSREHLLDPTIERTRDTSMIFFTKFIFSFNGYFRCKCLQPKVPFVHSPNFQNHVIFFKIMLFLKLRYFFQNSVLSKITLFLKPRYFSKLRYFFQNSVLLKITLFLKLPCFLKNSPFKVRQEFLTKIPCFSKKFPV